MNLDQDQTRFLGFKPVTWLYVLLGIVAISTISIYINYPSAYNQGLYHYQGLVIKNGGLPYTDFIEKKGPMGLLTYSLASLIFGESAMAYRIFDLLILAVTGLFLYRFVKLYYSGLTAVFASVVWFGHVIIDGPGNTGDVTNIITACYVVLAYHLIAPPKKHYYLIAGVIIALACWVKPTALIIALPIIFIFFRRRFKGVEQLNGKNITNLLLGMFIPTVIFTLYLLVTGTFYAFWEAVVLDPIFNYADDVSRFSLRTIVKTGKAFLADPFFRITGILCLILLKGNEVMKLSRLFVVGIAIMLFVEGRFYPYHYSVLWPFLAVGLAQGVVLLLERFKGIYQKLVVFVIGIVMLFPVYEIAAKMINAGVLTENYNAGNLFLFPDFKEMYDFRQPVVAYLNEHMQPEDEILVLGRDPNIYLETGAVTTCRAAREGHMLIKETQVEYLIGWQEELVQYMEDGKADWIILLKELEGKWIPKYNDRINRILSIKYRLTYDTIGHKIYQKRTGVE
jgi:hypothetical protein